MRTPTAILLAVILLGLGGAGVYGFTQLSGGGTLSEAWVSDTARTYQANHHSIAAATVDGETTIVAPLNELSSTDGLTDTSCALVRLDSATGDTVWEEGLVPEDCTAHAYPDPTFADVDRDGSIEVLVARGDHVLAVHDGESGAIEWRHEISALGYSQPVVADLLPAEGNEVVVVDLDGTVFAVYANGTTAWQHELSTAWAAPEVADFDGDDRREIAVGTGSAVHFFDPNGTHRWQVNGSARRIATGQADDDPAPELFAAGRGEVYAVDGASRSVPWSRDFDGTVAINDVGEGEDGTSRVYVARSGGTLYALQGDDGSVDWTARFPGENRVMPAPSLGDVDGDGTDELVAVTMHGVVSVVDPETGEQRATYERDVPIWTHPTLSDVDGDGEEEVLVIFGDGRVAALSYER